MAMSRLEFKMYNQNDFIKMANAMQKEREIQAELNRQAPLVDPDRFEQSFYDVFCGDEVVKPVNTSQAMFDAGFKQSDF